MSKGIQKLIIILMLLGLVGSSLAASIYYIIAAK